MSAPPELFPPLVDRVEYIRSDDLRNIAAALGLNIAPDDVVVVECAAALSLKLNGFAHAKGYQKLGPKQKVVMEWFAQLKAPCVLIIKLLGQDKGYNSDAMQSASERLRISVSDLSRLVLVLEAIAYRVKHVSIEDPRKDWAENRLFGHLKQNFELLHKPVRFTQTVKAVNTDDEEGVRHVSTGRAIGWTREVFRCAAQVPNAHAAIVALQAWTDSMIGRKVAAASKRSRRSKTDTKDAMNA